MSFPINKIIVYRDFIDYFLRLDIALKGEVYSPYCAGEYGLLVPELKDQESHTLKKTNTPLFNRSGLGKFVVDVGKNGIFYVELRAGSVLEKVIITPKEVVMDLYYSDQYVLIYSFYNPTKRAAININASIIEDQNNIYNKLKNDPTDPIWRQYFVRQALNEISSDDPPKSQFRELMTASQVADYLQVELKTINNWTSEGKIPFKKVGRLPRYIKTEIDVWMDSKNRKKKIGC